MSKPILHRVSIFALTSLQNRANAWLRHTVNGFRVSVIPLSIVSVTTYAGVETQFNLRHRQVWAKIHNSGTFKGGPKLISLFLNSNYPDFWLGSVKSVIEAQ